MRFGIIKVLLVSLTLTGCATFDLLNPAGRSVFDGGTSLVAAGQNPVSRTSLAAVETTYNAVVLGINAYYRRPICKPGEASSWTNLCSEPAVRRELAKYRRAARASILQAREFQKRGSASAVDAVRAAGNAVSDLRATATINGVNTQ